MPIEELLLDVVYKIGGPGVVDQRRRFDLERARFRLVPFTRCDHPVIGHEAQHQVSARARPLGVAQRRVAVGGRDDASQGGGFFQGQLPDIFVEKDVGRLPEADDAEGADLAQVDLVAVKLEDLALGEPTLEQHRHVGVGKLASQGPLRGQEVIFDELLRQGAGALCRPPRPQVGHERLHDPDRVDAAVAEESAVLRGEHRVDEDLGDLVIRHLPAFFASFIDGVAEQFRPEPEAFQGGQAVGVEHRFDPGAADADLGRAAGVGGSRRVVADQDPVGSGRPEPGRPGGRGPLLVPQSAEAGLQLVQGERFPRAEVGRGRVDAGGCDRPAVPELELNGAVEDVVVADQECGQ